MALWQNSSITSIWVGSAPNDGTGDPIRLAFEEVNSNFNNISTYLRDPTLAFYNATVEESLQAQFGNIANLFVANATGTIANFTGNITGDNLISNTGLYSLGTSNFTGDVNAINVLVSGQTDLFGPTITHDNIVPAANLTYDLGSPTQFFRNLYVQTTISSQQISASSDAGLLRLHANLNPGDIKDVGILGTFNKYGANSYAFFGYQHTTDDFVYKITTMDATLGNSVVYDGVYGNVHFGSAFLSNVSAGNTLIVAGDTNLVGNVYSSGNVYAAGNAFINSANIGTAAINAVQGNLNVAGTIFSGGSPLLAINQINNYASVFPGGQIYGNLIVANVGGINYNMVVSGNSTIGGNLTATNLIGPYYGTVQTSAQPNITSVGTLQNLTANGLTVTGFTSFQSIGGTLITSGNINTGVVYAGFATVSGTLTVGNIVGNVNAGLISASTINAATIGNTNSVIVGNITTAAQPGITSLGTLTGLTVGGTIISTSINAATIGNVGAALVGNGAGITNIPSSGILGTVATSAVSALSNVQANSSNAAFYPGIYNSVTGNLQTYTSSLVSINPSNGNVSALNFVGGYYGTIQTAAQPNITSLGTLNGLSVNGSGVIDNGNRVISTTTGDGNLTISGSSISLTPIGPGGTGAGSATNIPNLQIDRFGRVIALGTQVVNATFGVAGSTGIAAVQAGAGAGTLSIVGQYGVTAIATVANSTSATVTIGTPQDLRITATPQFYGVIPTSNVSCDIGSLSMWWNNIYGTAVHAKYADLAEKYTADQEYAPGTVVIFGGDEEVTISTVSHDDRVAGVVSTNPAYLMNGALDGLTIALTGRVPCLVLGPVAKGDKMVASGKPGYAQRMDRNLYSPGCIIGKALEDFLGDEGVIEVVVGRL